MNKELKSIRAFTIASAIIWAAIIMGCSLTLKETGCYDEIQYILAGGVITHLLFIWGPLFAIFKKYKTNSSEDSIKV